MGWAEHAVPLRELPSCEIASNAKDYASFDWLLSKLARPVHVLSMHKEDRRQSRKLRCHVHAGTFPEFSFFDMGNGVLVMAPWLCFALMAKRLSLSECMLLGMELCGCYSTHPQHLARMQALGDEETLKRGYLIRPPLTTPQKLEASLSTLYANGRNVKSLQAARWLAENSRSPMESRLYLLLCLKGVRGGYGISRPLLNCRIELPAWVARASDRQYFECDLYWPSARVAVEYDGQNTHSTAPQRARDNVRRNMLEHLGIRVVVLDKCQLSNERETDDTVRVLCGYLGEKGVRESKRTRQARLKLRAELLAWNRNLYDPR